jgi:hypothetical protein
VVFLPLLGGLPTVGGNLFFENLAAGHRRIQGG